MHWVDAQTHGFDYRLEFNDWLQYLGPKTAIYADELGRPNSGSAQPEIDELWTEEGDPWKDIRHKDEREGSVHVGRISLLSEKDHFDSFVARTRTFPPTTSPRRWSLLSLSVRFLNHTIRSCPRNVSPICIVQKI